MCVYVYVYSHLCGLDDLGVCLCVCGGGVETIYRPLRRFLGS
jgi:hypothetical protein